MCARIAKNLLHTDERHSNLADGCIDPLDADIATCRIQRLATQGRHQLHCRKTFVPNGLLACGEDEPPYSLSGEDRVRIHRPNPGRIASRIEQSGRAQIGAMVATIERRASAPAPASHNDTSLLDD
jgi:hypothetical protein